MKIKPENIRSEWLRVAGSARFRNILMFLIFVAIATVFWFIIALNDNVTETFRVKVQIVNVPDSVTFITDPPSDIHVTLRDKGTSILRSGVVKKPEVFINFADYAHDGILRLSQSDFMAELKADLGGAATITSSSIDSLRLFYTMSPGRRVPVVVNADIKAASGYVIQGAPVSTTKFVRVYSYHDEIDTIIAVHTKKLVKKGLSQTSNISVALQPIPHVKIIPAKVDVRVKVEPLVHKEVFVNVEVVNTPVRESLLLFPNKVPVSFYVPMSRFNDEDYRIKVQADYNDIKTTHSSNIPVKIMGSSPGLINIELRADSVEYTLVKH
ncbi:MAG: hypothetical protein HDS71_08025 [Bacteroidales bacterium]|nr:hypothetical protein [Bacteroidales bacterium]MBD5223975.1 hypothetical protein [Bacteroidales bacterium]MBD5349123.1 hypothetical protein [Bacteroides sp.]